MYSKNFEVLLKTQKTEASACRGLNYVGLGTTNHTQITYHTVLKYLCVICTLIWQCMFSLITSTTVVYMCLFDHHWWHALDVPVKRS